MKKRLFLESDFLSQDEYRSAQRKVKRILADNNIECCEGVFDEVRDFAWQRGDPAWEAVKNCDEIYSDTSLVPLSGYGTYTGSVVVMDVMMQKAIDEGITGKSLFFLRHFEDIEWDGIDITLLKKCFIDNDLYTLEYDEDYNSFFKKVDVNEIKDLD